MRQLSLREFRTRGTKVLESIPEGETILLAGQQGPAYFLVPVFGDLANQDRELRRAMAKASLRKGWALGKASGLKPLDHPQIMKEIAFVRSMREDRKPR